MQAAATAPGTTPDATAGDLFPAADAKRSNGVVMDGRHALLATKDASLTWDISPGLGGAHEMTVRYVNDGAAPLPVEMKVVSPDGTMVAYSLSEAGQVNLYIDRFRALGSQHLVARQVGRTARWRADSRELFFTAGNNVMAARIVPGASPTAGSATSAVSLAKRRLGRHS